MVAVFLPVSTSRILQCVRVSSHQDVCGQQVAVATNSKCQEVEKHGAFQQACVDDTCSDALAPHYSSRRPTITVAALLRLLKPDYLRSTPDDPSLFFWVISASPKPCFLNHISFGRSRICSIRPSNRVLYELVSSHERLGDAGKGSAHQPIN